jgi:hypothetical protein
MAAAVLSPPWTTKVEVAFLDALERFPPVGVDRQFNLLSLRLHLNKMFGNLLFLALIYFVPFCFFARAH